LLAIAMASNAEARRRSRQSAKHDHRRLLANPYDAFAAALWPVAAMGMLLTALLIFLIYRREFLTTERLPELRCAPPESIASRLQVRVRDCAMMVLFFAGNQSPRWRL